MEAVVEIFEEVEESVVEEKLGHSPTEVAEILGEGYDSKRVRRELRSGNLEGLKVDGRWTITDEQIESYKVLQAEKAQERAEAKKEALAEAAAAKETSEELDEREEVIEYETGTAGELSF